MSSLRFNAADHGPPIPGIIGTSPAMEAVYRVTRRVARTNASVLLLGETGTGKEMIATAIHKLSSRATGPFVKVNCGALSESLLESELFGHVRGAFTGAVNNRTGRFEAAHTGTIFLDEINSTSLFLQVKLLRVLQEREFERVGDTTTIRVDTRVIAASNRNLADEVAAEKFREDLYWRLNVVPVLIPPLRERRDDVAPLARMFVRECAERLGRPLEDITEDAAALLAAAPWDGNVRELRNVIERACLLADGGRLTTTDIQPCLPDDGDHATTDAPPARSLAAPALADGEPPLLATVERDHILRALQHARGNKKVAARLLGVSRRALYRRLERLGLEGTIVRRRDDTPDGLADGF
jgi:transcriptional regulator with GAF, ATPase, and Fis domain